MTKYLSVSLTLADDGRTVIGGTVSGRIGPDPPGEPAEPGREQVEAGPAEQAAPAVADEPASAPFEPGCEPSGPPAEI